MTETEATTATRLDALEAELAHHDATIRDLSDVVTKQWETIDRLTQTVDGLTRALASLAEASGEDEAGEEPPPPHY